ncbi:MAG TPA: DUF5719 family protein [Acidimicrobiales bacterium]|nr:DUF5719 family protein [Acidimicrobiales bacterium]
MSRKGEVSTLRRRLIVGGFVIVFAGAGVLNFAVKRHDLAGIEGAQAATSAVALGSHASSSAWYCPGPLPIGHRGEQSSIEVVNLSVQPVHLQVHIAANSGLSELHSYALSGLANQTIVLPGSKLATYGAASVVVEGRGVGVYEVVVTPTGITTSPCTTHTASSAFFGTGSTAGSANMAISLFNPGATPAVADVRFIVGANSFLPGAFSSVPIEPGQDVVLFAGHALPQRNAMALAVTIVSGRIAVGALHFKVANQLLTRSIVLGSQVPLGTWWFAPVVVAPSIEQVFSLYNPTAHGERVRITLLGDGAEGVSTVFVGAGANLRYVAPRPSIAGLQAGSVSVAGRGSLIVDRAIAANRSFSPVAKVRLIQLPAALPTGYAVTAPNVAPAKVWMIGAVRSDSVASGVVAVANPGDRPAEVAFEEIARGGSIPIPGVGSILVAARSIVSIDLSRHLNNMVSLGIVIHATRAVVAGMTEFGRSRSGLSAPAALPVR